MKRNSQYKTRTAAWLPFGLWRIDWYYIRTYVKSFVIIILAIAALVTISDLFQRFDDFVILSRREEQDFTATVMTFLKYYSSFVPQLIFQYMFPVTMLLAASITATASYSGPKGNNEYIVIRSAGIPVLRSFYSFLIPAFIIALAFQAGRDFFLPGMVRESAAITNRLKSRQSNPTSVSLIGPDGYQTAAIGWFSPDGVGHNMILEVRDAEAFQRGDAARGDNDFVAYRAAAARLAPDEKGQYYWIPLDKATIQSFSQFHRRETEWVNPVRTTMTPAMVERQTLGDSVSSWRDLLILREDNAGAKFEMHYRLSDPIACCILILWGTGTCMGLMLRGRSASFISSITVSMLVAGCFYVMRLAGRTLWESGTLTPEQGAWYPVAVSAVIALAVAFWMER